MRIDSGLDAKPGPTEAPPASRADQPPTGLRLWLAAIRPRTLTIAVAPVVAATAVAWAEARLFDPMVLAATLLGALAIQAGTNLWNDVADALRGGDQPLRQGPPR
ncbi:MAG: 1,4-dihydroxy-2-naphthoate octaprenyltransferase, partial [Pseudomonadota bacterium]